MSEGVLQTILDSQARFQKELADNPELPGQVGMDTNAALGWTATAIMCEAAELLDWTNWKRHKRSYGQPLTEEQKREGLIEVVDILHFMVNAFLLYGVTDEQEILRMYRAKHVVNHTRQDEEY